MPAMIFDKCCGCIELRTGCLIIGYLELVAHSIASIVLLFLVVASSVVIAQQDNSDEKVAGWVVMAIGVIALLVLALYLVIIITLLVGLHKNKRGHVKAYLIYAGIYFFLAAFGFFGIFAGKIEAWNVIGYLNSLVLRTYYWLVIRSYYHKMEDSN